MIRDIGFSDGVRVSHLYMSTFDPDLFAPTVYIAISDGYIDFHRRSTFYSYVFKW